jgi:hypothetical protein
LNSGKTAYKRIPPQPYRKDSSKDGKIEDLYEKDTDNIKE